MNVYPQLKCFVPQNLDFNIIPEYKEKHKEKYIWMIHSILYKSLTSKTSFQGYVNLNKELLVKYIGSKFYVNIKNRLIESGIIEYNKSYNPSAFSKSYRLSKKYRTAPIACVDITKQTYCRKVYMSKSEYLRDVFKDNKLLQKEFNALTFARIKLEDAINYINTNYDHKSQQYKSRYVAIMQFEAMHKASLSNGSYVTDFTFIENKGRVYTPYTMLARDLEQFIYFTNHEDESTCTLDMPNSQLCFYSELIERKKRIHIGSSDNDRNDRIIRNIGFAPNHTNENIDNHNIIPYVYHFSDNWDDYIFNGLGYERMMYLSNWKGKTHGHSKEERQEFKEEFFGQLFYNKYSDRLTDLEMIFYQHHESTAKALRELKKAIGNKLLAVEVQRLESIFFHKMIVGYMSKNYRNVPYLIKHDSITLPSKIACEIHDELNKLVSDFFKCQNLKLKA